MPLVFQQDINGEAVLALWQITEEENFFLEKVSAGRTVSNTEKRIEHLAGRYLLNQVSNGFPFEKVTNGSGGKPILEDNGIFFSISHSTGYAAVIKSSTKNVAIDLELISNQS